MNLNEPENDNIRQAPAEPTPGPYDIRVREDFDPEIYSTATGQPLAHVYSLGFKHQDEVDNDPIILKNAALLKAAPQLKESLETILETESNLRHSTVDGIRKLLAEIDAGPSEAFHRQREEDRRRYEYIIQLQCDEMARQTDSEAFTIGDPDEDEEPGPSFDY